MNFSAANQDLHLPLTNKYFRETLMPIIDRDLEHVRKEAWLLAITRDLPKRKEELKSFAQGSPGMRVKRLEGWSKQHRTAFLDQVRTIAWYSAVRSATELSEADLAKENLSDHSEKQEPTRWDRYRDGKSVPQPKTVQRIDEHSSGVAKGTASVFNKGPELLPLWAVFGFGSAKPAWREAADAWFLPVDKKLWKQRFGDPTVTRLTPLVARVDVAWVRLVPPDAVVDFHAYTHDLELNAVTARACADLVKQRKLLRKRADGAVLSGRDSAALDAILARLKAEIDLTTFVGVIALWRLAESAGERVNEARYLARGVLPWAPLVLMPWGIGEQVYEHLNCLVPFPVASNADIFLTSIIQRALDT